MPAPTKKRPVETTVLHATGPWERHEEAVRALTTLGFTVTLDSIPWRQAFPDITDEQLPGVVLRGARSKEGVTQAELAAMIGIPQRHISEMENAKRSIGKEMAKKLGAALNIGYRVFL